MQPGPCKPRFLLYLALVHLVFLPQRHHGCFVASGGEKVASMGRKSPSMPSLPCADVLLHQQEYRTFAPMGLCSEQLLLLTCTSAVVQTIAVFAEQPVLLSVSFSRSHFGSVQQNAFCWRVRSSAPLENTEEITGVS